MELFRKAKVVRLRSHHNKYLLAEDDEESVCQDRNGSCRGARWSVEYVGGSDSLLRLVSCYGLYLTASNVPFLLGVTGHKVLQTRPARLDSSVEWEPIREGFQVKMKTRYGHFLRANGGLPPWRNSVTHDIPSRTATQDWVLWDVDVIELDAPPPQGNPMGALRRVGASSDAGGATSDQITPHRYASFSKLQRVSPRPSPVSSPDWSKRNTLFSASESPRRTDGRQIHYHVADNDGEIEEHFEGHPFTFKGSSLEELTQKLEEETGLEDIIVCNRSPLNGMLYPLRLQLPPNNVAMKVVVVQSSSRVAKSFAVPENPL